MSAERVAQIARAVRKVLDSPGDGWCATFELAGADDAWAQLMKGTLNVAYPLARTPSAADAAGLPGAAVASWEANKFVTYEFEGGDAQAIAKAMDHLFTKFFARDDASVDVRIENLDA